MTTLQKALTGNAITSFLSGLALIFYYGPIASVFETSNQSAFWIIGILLVFFSLTIVVEIRKKRALAILWIIAQDSLWVIASILVLLFHPFNISSTGYLLIGAMALLVLVFVILQTVGLAQMDQIGKGRKKLLRFTRLINANKHNVWKVLSDVGNYHLVAPNIDNVQLISGEGQGMVRSCAQGDKRWKETCTLWEEDKQFSFMIDTSAPDYPYPYKFLQGTWSINEISTNKTEVIMEFEFEYSKNIFAVVLHPLAKTKYTKISNDLLDNWQRKMEA